MMFLDLYTLPNSTAGIDEILVETTSAVPGVTVLLLVFIYAIVMIGGIRLQANRSGFADYPMWSVVASISTFMVALLMSVIEGLIRLDILVIITVITIFSGVWLFFDRKTSEV